MINYVKGDATLPNNIDGFRGTIVMHICNDDGAWGSGFVLAVSKRYKEAETAYRKWHRDFTFHDEDEEVPFKLGRVQFVTTKGPTIANMIAQSDPGGNTIEIGQEKVHVAPIRYDSLRECLLRVASYAKKYNLAVAGPRIGSERAGGSWGVIAQLIEDNICKYNIPVTIYDWN